MTNQVALSEIISLWNHYQTDENFKFPRGMAGFKQLFRTLYDVHKWGIQERLEDTGLTEIWKEELQDASLEKVKVQIELFFRSSISKRQEVEDNIKNIVIQVGGEIFSCSVIPEIEYHAILAAVPREYAQKIIDREEVALVIAEPIMFLKPCVQALFSSDNNNFSDSNSFSVPTNVIEDPIIAMFDGAPQANHPLLKGMLTVDDPDGFESFYEVRERVHGTSMASLILRGQDMSTIEDKIRKVYVRPIMKPETWNNKVMEYIPDDFLLVDKIHEAVRRLFEPEAGQVASNVRIINLSIGIRYREFYNIISPLARLLDWLSYKYRVLFIVSAGNHPDEIETGIDFNIFKNLSDEEKDSIIIKFIDQDIRNKRLLSPAESMNALTVGAIFADNNDENPIGSLAKLCSDNIPAVYSSFGSGINNAIKPDIFFPGGRNLVHEDYMHRGMVKWRESSTRAPGISSAAPGLTMGAIVNKAFSFGTSDATALVTNKAQECYAVLDEIFMKETGMGVPNEYVAVLIKAMLAHGASWNGWDKLFQGVLNISGTNAKNALHRYLGYGEPDVDKVKECTKEQVTLIGFGDIAQDKAFIYSIPIPIEFHEKRLKRKLTVTLAYLSPIHPSSIKYREKQVWMTINNGNSLIGSRAEYDYHAVQRGTLQHEIFENNSIEVWNSDEQLHIWRANWADAVNKMLARNQINATIDHRSFADQGITEQPTIHEGYIAQNMEKKGMISDRCEINRQIRADNKMLRELKVQVAKLAEAVEKSIPIIAETLEAIRNHMIFTQYHLLHNEMQKEVIHDWMNHFNPILNKYNAVKKKLKAKVSERKELNVQKDKTSILNPIQHIKLNQQLTTVTEEIEELKSRKEQLIFQAQCTTDKDMMNLSKKYDQMNKNLDVLDSQDTSLKKQLEKDATAFREEKFRPEPEQYTKLLDTRIQIRPDFLDKLIEQLKGAFGKYYDYHRRDIAANEVDYLNVEDPDVFSHRAWELEYQRKLEIRRNQPARTKKRSHNLEI